MGARRWLRALYSGAPPVSHAPVRSAAAFCSIPCALYRRPVLRPPCYPLLRLRGPPCALCCIPALCAARSSEERAALCAARSSEERATFCASSVVAVGDSRQEERRSVGLPWRRGMRLQRTPLPGILTSYFPFGDLRQLICYRWLISQFYDREIICSS